MKLIAACLALLMLAAPAWADKQPDDLIVTGPNFKQMNVSRLLVTPDGGSQTTLGAALAAAAGSAVPPGPTSLGGVFSNSATTHQWVTGITTGGHVTLAQPTCGDLADAGSGCSSAAGAVAAPSSGVLGGVFSTAATTHNWITGITTSGSVTRAQPTCADLADAGSGCSGAAGNGTTAPTPSALGGVFSLTPATHQYVTGVGTDGTVSKSQPSCADLADAGSGCSGSAAGSIPTPTASTIGGVNSATATAHQWVKSIGTDGSIAKTQPACGDISDAGLGCAWSSLPLPTGSALGGILSSTAVTHQWITGVGGSGAVTRSQPACADISDAATGCSAPRAVAAITSGAIDGVSVGQTTPITALTSSGVAQAIGLYGGRQQTITYSGTQKAFGTTDYTLLTDANLIGSISSGSVNHAAIIVNVDAVNLTATAGTSAVTWFDINGNVGFSMWAPTTAYTLGQKFNNGGRVYQVTTAGTSASSGGPTGTGTGITDGTVVWNFVSADFSGNRAATQAIMNINGRNDPATPNDSYRQWQASLNTLTIAANQGGSGTGSGQTAGFTYAGGDQMWAFNGATNLSGVVGRETDVGLFGNASSYQRTGMQVVAFGDNQGAHDDSAYRIVAGPSAANPTTLWTPGFKQGIEINYQSIDPAGWLMQLTQPPSGSIVGNNFPPVLNKIGGGIDLFGFDIQTAALRSAGGLILDKSGAVNVGPAKLAATGASVTLDAVGYYPSWTAGAPTNGGTSYRATERLTDSFGNIWVVTAVNGSGVITTLTLLTPAGTSSGSSPSGAITLLGGTGVSATVTPTWTRVSQLSLNPAGGAVQFGSGAFAANGSVATALSSVGPTGAHTTVQEWFMVTDSGGTVRYIPAF